jgi:hypothetical protein
MVLVTSGKARLFALVALAALGVAPFARANINDYEFTLIEQEIKKGDAIVSVRLAHKPDGKLVPDAGIFATRLDMAPDGMEMMTTDIERLPSGELGVYRFKAALTMPGRWRLSIAAKLQGEADTLENKLMLRALP